MSGEATALDTQIVDAPLGRVLDLVGVGADGASYRMVREPEGEVEIWRLHPSAVDGPLRRRLEALRTIPAPGLLPIREILLDGASPYVIVGRGRLRWADLDAIDGGVDAWRTTVSRLARALGAAHLLDVVHGALGAHCVAVDASGHALLDLTRLRVRPPEPALVAPERHGRPTAAADVWALGELLASSPAAARSVATQLDGMRDPDPERRPRAIDVARALSPEDEPTEAPTLAAPASEDGGGITERFGVPSRLGAYELMESIGTGGMGRVFRARDVAGGPDVAVKVLLPTWASDPDVVARFRREARMLAQLESPYVARFIAANHDGGVHYLVMEYVDGSSAQALLKARGRLDVDRAVGITCDVARAVAELHAIGLVHRDIKPANILVEAFEDTPRVKLCDFGIARPVEAAGEDQLTSGGMPGTPSYMAPEQIEARAVDARADVYSLGATLYCLLSGRPPFVGNAHLVMIAHLSEAPSPLRDHDPSIPQAISDVVMRCLAKAPDERYRDATELHEALQAAWRGASASVDALPQALGIDGTPRVFDFAWTLAAEPEELWPHVSNTERLNRAAGLDDVEWSHAPGEGYVRTEGRLRAAGMELRWKENPFEWVAPTRLGVVREYVAGPFEWLRNTVTLLRRDGGGTDLRHTIEIRPRGLLGRAAASIEVGLRLRRGLERVYRRIDTACMVARDKGGPTSSRPPDPFEGPEAASNKRRRLVDERIGRILGRGGDPHVVEALAELVCTAPTPRIARIRPRVWAREHGFADGPALDTMLLAVAEGVLELMWDILCPSCRIPSSIEESLRSLETHGRCEVCDLDFELDMARSVELVFRAHPAIRVTELGVYCIGGPAHSPHVLAQVRLAAAERFALDVNLDVGRYCIAGRGVPRRWTFAVDDRAPLDQWDLPLRAGASPDAARSLQPGPSRIMLTNDLGHEVVVRLERATEREDAVTAADAAANGTFRELFPDQVLSPERLVAVSDVALLFAHVPDALARYEHEEAAVHRELMSLSTRVEEAAGLEGGALVRLHGDGVVAVFSDRVAAVRAALRCAHPDAPIGLALHAGPARMTSIGGQLDYFGKTLHLAEHISRWAEAGDVVVSESLLADESVAPILAARTRTRGYVRLGELLACRLTPVVDLDAAS